MQIRPAPFSYGQVGLQRSQDTMQQAAKDIAHASTRSNGDVSNSPAASLQDSLINLKSSELEAQANVKVIAAEDRTLGSLIDIKA